LGNNNAEWGEILDVDNYWSNVTVTTCDQGSTGNNCNIGDGCVTRRLMTNNVMYDGCSRALACNMIITQWLSLAEAFYQWLPR